jgi:hypothetical protein
MLYLAHLLSKNAKGLGIIFQGMIELRDMALSLSPFHCFSHVQRVETDTDMDYTITDSRDRAQLGGRCR